MMRTVARALVPGLLGALLAAAAHAQNATPRELAPFDPTGYWVAVITEDWRWRMVTPPKGDYASVPLNARGRAAADEWDPAEQAAGCKAYGAAGLMRMPLRLHITWADDRTLEVEADHGRQTRLLHFEDEAPDPESPSLQGHSVARWEGNPGGRFEFVNIGPEISHLTVVTTNLAPGYLRKNGVPYSERTVLTEYFDHHADFGEEWLTVTSIVDDPVYLSEEFITSSSFKRLPDRSGWNPVPCE
ncbi:MAG TPA: hypothetical protein VIM81_18390 [Gammaproteobacteria bacterium]